MTSTYYSTMPTADAGTSRAAAMYAGDSFGPGAGAEAAHLHDLSHSSAGMQLAGQSFSEARSPVGAHVMKSVQDWQKNQQDYTSSLRAQGGLPNDRLGSAFSRKLASGAELPQLQLSASLSLEEGMGLVGTAQGLSGHAPSLCQPLMNGRHSGTGTGTAHAAHTVHKSNGHSRASTSAGGVTTAPGYRPSRGFTDGLSDTAAPDPSAPPTSHTARRHTAQLHREHKGGKHSDTCQPAHPAQGYRELHRSPAASIPALSYSTGGSSGRMEAGGGHGGLLWHVADVRSWLAPGQAALLPPHTPLSQPLVWQDSGTGATHMLVGTELSPLPSSFMPGLPSLPTSSATSCRTAVDQAGKGTQQAMNDPKAVQTVARPNYLLHIVHSGAEGRAEVIPLPPLAASLTPLTSSAHGGAPSAGAAVGAGGSLLSKATPLLGTGEYIRQLVWLQQPCGEADKGSALGVMGQYLLHIDIHKASNSMSAAGAAVAGYSVTCAPILLKAPWGAAALPVTTSTANAVPSSGGTHGGTGANTVYISPDELRAVTVSPHTLGLIATAGHDGTVSVLQLGTLGGSSGDPRVITVLETHQGSVVSDVSWSSSVPDVLLWALEGGAIQSADVGPFLHKDGSAVVTSRGRASTRTSTSTTSSMPPSMGQGAVGRVRPVRPPTFTKEAGLACIVPLEGLSCPTMSLTDGLAGSSSNSMPCEAWLCGYLTGGVQLAQVFVDSGHGAHMLAQQTARVAHSALGHIDVQPWVRDPAVAEISMVLPMPVPTAGYPVSLHPSARGQANRAASPLVGRPQVRARHATDMSNESMRFFACTGAEGWSLWLAQAGPAGVEMSCVAHGQIASPAPPVSTDFTLQCAAVGACVPPAQGRYGPSQLYLARAHVNAAWLCDSASGHEDVGQQQRLVITDVYGAVACLDLSHIIRNAVQQARDRAAAMDSASIVPAKRVKLDMVTRQSDGEAHILPLHQQQSPGAPMPPGREKTGAAGRAAGKDTHYSRSTAGPSSRVQLPSPAYGGAAARLAVVETPTMSAQGPVNDSISILNMNAGLSASSLASDMGVCYPLHSAGLGMSVGRPLPSLGPAAGSGGGFLAGFSGQALGHGGIRPLGMSSHLPGLSAGAGGLGVSFNLPTFNAQALCSSLGSSFPSGGGFEGSSGVVASGPRYGAPPRASRNGAQAHDRQTQEGSRSRSGHQGTASTAGPLLFSLPPASGHFPATAAPSFQSALSSHLSPMFASYRRQQASSAVGGGAAPVAASDVHVHGGIVGHRVSRGGGAGSSSVSASSSAAQQGAPAGLTAQMYATALSSGMSMADPLAQ